MWFNKIYKAIFTHRHFPANRRLSIDVLSKLKIHLGGGGFIDLILLFNSAREFNEHFETEGLQFRNGVLCLVKQKRIPYLSIEKWSSAVAFVIFTSIMLEKYITWAQEFLKYKCDVSQNSSVQVIRVVPVRRIVSVQKTGRVTVIMGAHQVRNMAIIRKTASILSTRRSKKFFKHVLSSSRHQLSRS